MWRVTFSFFSPSLALSISVRSRAKAQTCSHKTSWIFELRSNESISSLEKKHTFSYSLLPIETRSSSTVNTVLWRFVLTESNQIKNFSFHSFFWSYFKKLLITSNGYCRFSHEHFASCDENWGSIQSSRLLFGGNFFTHFCREVYSYLSYYF